MTQAEKHREKREKKEKKERGGKLILIPNPFTTQSLRMFRITTQQMYLSGCSLMVHGFLNKSPKCFPRSARCQAAQLDHKFTPLSPPSPHSFNNVLFIK